jgi:hypothetical protein
VIADVAVTSLPRIHAKSFTNTEFLGILDVALGVLDCIFI